MITLREAFSLCDIRDDEVVWFDDSKRNPGMFKYPMEGKDVRKKLDMRNTKVVQIRPVFNFGEYEGMLFIVDKAVR